MTPNNLYEMEPEKVTNEFVPYLLKNSHVYESGVPDHDIDWDFKSDKIEIRVLKDFDFDGRRCWTLCTVWYEEHPVMIIQNAGREGDDHVARFITARERFIEMCIYLRSLVDIEDSDEDVVSCDKDIPELTDFYSNNLYGFFERY